MRTPAFTCACAFARRPRIRTPALACAFAFARRPRIRTPALACACAFARRPRIRTPALACEFALLPHMRMCTPATHSHAAPSIRTTSGADMGQTGSLKRAKKCQVSPLALNLSWSLVAFARFTCFLFGRVCEVHVQWTLCSLDHRTMYNITMYHLKKILKKLD